ncbi:dihydropteroate synthase [Falsirhodobacter xinxiangensis]|uniref:dihydropteroate synthase n=1 Tax=Falsirhodobacter xinxiangensis TaxID=2530049 RepID=UPI0010AAF79E|nr:dihydropteroate synthase [Rhodobacter xinxiangensis]
MIYYRPIAMTDPARPDTSRRLAGGWCWFDRAEAIGRDGSSRIVHVDEIPPRVLDRLTAPRADVARLAMDMPRLMAVVNVTPDSFSDGGRFRGLEDAVAGCEAAVSDGADMLDIGGESTRPGAETVDETEEVARVAPLIHALRAGSRVPISVDTRKARVADAAVQAGADLVNDVSAMLYDPAMAAVAAGSGRAICLMHSQGGPRDMQINPSYENVLLDVYDHLEDRIAAAEAAGIDRARIVVDPGIGFGKTLAHNLALIRGLSLFHGLGCAVLLGVSRKRFIGTVGRAEDAAARMPGSIAVALAGVAQGVQILRVHDVAETRQALSLWQASTLGV